MKRLLTALVFSLLLILTTDMATPESSAFKEPSDYDTGSQTGSKGKSVNLITFTNPEDIIKKDSIPNEVISPFMCLKLQWDTEKPIPYMQLDRHYKEKDNWQVLQLLLIFQIALP